MLHEDSLDDDLRFHAVVTGGNNILNYLLYIWIPSVVHKDSRTEYKYFNYYVLY
jgi:hypothetical protein